jgi:hypothetical protein
MPCHASVKVERREKLFELIRQEDKAERSIVRARRSEFPKATAEDLECFKSLATKSLQASF